LFVQKDIAGNGDLKVEEIKEFYAEYCGKLVNMDEIDTLLSKCTV
jgi:hypothetical protein